ncbi:DoxX family protein [Pontiellaceae bacterium B12227]|nr:DoxX family protein [Pontiellaceae bacterium B12227]
MNTLLLLILKIAVSVAFLSTGVAKLMKARPMVNQFHEFRLPLEIMYLIGVLEVVGAAALWYAPMSLWVFSCLGCLMAGAIKSHFDAKHAIGSMLPSVILLGLCIAGALLDGWLN